MPSRLIQDDHDRCYLCGHSGVIHKHHIFGSSRRGFSEKDGLYVHLCVGCHTHVHGKYGAEMQKYLHEIGQQAYEEQIGTRQQFMERYGKNYL